MDTWESKSNTTKQRVVIGAILIAGVILMIGFRNFDATGLTNSLSGFFLGVLLFVVAVLNIITELEQTISVDPDLRQIVIENKKRFFGNFQKTTKIISFDEITRHYVTESGNHDNGSPSYYITLCLKDGKTYPLFFPAYFEGQWSKAAVEEKNWNLERLMKN